MGLRRLFSFITQPGHNSENARFLKLPVPSREKLCYNIPDFDKPHPSEKGTTMKHYTRLTALFLCLLLLLPCHLAAESAAFPDVPENSWYAFSVRELSARGVISGYPDGNFGPGNTVSWAEALKLILLSAGWPEQSPDENGWAGGYLRLAREQGWLDDPETQLTGPITRLDTARLTARALGLEAVSMASPFADCTDGEVLALTQQEIFTGVLQDGLLYFLPEGQLTRAEISVILWRVLRWREQHAVPPTGETGSTIEAPETEKPQLSFQGELLDIWEDVPVNTYDQQAFYLENGRMQTRDDSLRLMHGIDVSYHQGEIDWQQVAEDGISFAILRAGFRGYTAGSLNEDELFSQNLQGAMQAGLEVGVYFFSQAITPEEAEEEARLVLELLDGCPLQFPVVYDWETISNADARTRGLDRDTLTDCALAFCRTIAEAGYQPMIYFNQSLAYRHYDLSRLTEYPFWLAQYQEQPDFYYDFRLWQYSSKGSVAGISGNVDLDVLLLPEN